MKNTVAVIGAGQMGTGIVQYLIIRNINVLLFGYNDDNIQKSVKKLHKNFEKLYEKQKISEIELTNYKNRIKTSTDLKDCGKANFIIEAIPEDLNKKIKLIKELNDVMNENAIFATNTSSFSITEMGSYYKYPKQFIGLHFFNPVIKMPLVEIIKGLETSEEVINASKEFIQMIQKESVMVMDQPGFVVNRILIPMINEAIFVLQEGTATAEEIDISMKLGTNQPMGPLALADYIGLDTCLAIMESLHRTFGEDKYRPAILLKKYVAANKLGMKSKAGFYNY